MHTLNCIVAFQRTAKMLQQNFIIAARNERKKNHGKITAKFHLIIMLQRRRSRKKTSLHFVDDYIYEKCKNAQFLCVLPKQVYNYIGRNCSSEPSNSTK